jgi:hypothetical protein
MNKQENYVAPGVAIHPVVLEQFIAAAVSYTRSVSDDPQYYEYEEQPEFPVSDFILN